MAGVSVGGALLSSFLNVLFDRLTSRQFLDFVSGKKNDIELLLKELKIKLLTANKLVDDAEEKQMTSPTVRKWLDDLKHAVYVVGELLDEINTEALRREVEGEDHSGSSSSTNWIMTTLTRLKTTPSDEFEKTLKPKIQNILRVLQLILNEKDELGLKEEAVKDRAQERMRQTTSRVDGSGVFGREKDTETIVNLLRSDDTTGHKIGVLPIVGMGGVGKTTLAQLVYKDVKDNFGVRAWVYVGDEFDILKIAQTIYEGITQQTCAITNLDLLSEKLEKVLIEKKFLFVLDDVWSEDYNLWNNFMTQLKQCGVHGSKIVVTTRLERVASMVGTLSTHHLRELSEDVSWLLFARHAFIDAAIVDSRPYLGVVGRQIVKKCKGLPLAAQSLGGLLRSVLNPKEWEKILKSDIWELPNDKILPALWLSYRYLPSHLKRCFSYCSIFPKDYKFTESSLILLWMAEDMLSPTEKETVEEVGKDCFDILLSRSFFQLSGSKNLNGESFFTMHDLINDLAKFVSGEFCLRLDDHQPLNINASKIRHVSYMKRGRHGFENFEAKYLHTFLPLPIEAFFLPVFDHSVIRDAWPKLSMLRVLNLLGYDIVELPSSIGNLKHLRHLDLSYSLIKQLPETVCTLYNLQTLLLSGCRALVQLPAKLGRLINLRHLDIRGTDIEKMPPNMGNLKNLQTLSDFVLDKHNGHSIAELKKLQNLHGAISISGLNNIVHVKDALEARIIDKKHLDKLILRWAGYNYADHDPSKDGEVLDKLQPHTNLREVVIECYGGISFPGWLGEPSFANLSCIELKHCENCCLLPPLGQLPSLRQLLIGGFDSVVEIGSEFCGNASCGTLKPFRCLEELSFEDMLEWQEWSSDHVGSGRLIIEDEEDGGIFPNLRWLTVRNCPKLTEMLPLDNFLKLERLTLKDTESLSGLSLSRVKSKCPKFLSLRHLVMEICPNFVCFPDGGIDAPSLKYMRICGGKRLRSLPEQMHALLPSLETLIIFACPELDSFSQGGLPSKLERLSFDCSGKLFANRAQWGLQRLASLRRLFIDFEQVVCGADQLGFSFPEEGLLLPAALTNLAICNLSNLTTIQGNELRQQLPSLEYFTISNCPELQCFAEEAPNSMKCLKIQRCPKLQCLPVEWLSASLSQLTIWDSPMLEQRVQRDTGRLAQHCSHPQHIG